MIPQSILEYLQTNQIAFRCQVHRPAISGQEVAAALAISGWQVTKSVLVSVEGLPWMAVLPAAVNIDLIKLGHAFQADSVRLLDESEFLEWFPGCQLGAEPPFGALYGIPVILEESLVGQPSLVMRAGSHMECIELATKDFLDLEKPRLASFAEVDELTEVKDVFEIRIC